MVLILGVGVGIFVLTFFWTLALIVCLLSSRAKGRVRFAGIAAILLSSVITICLVLIPQESTVPPAKETAKVYNNSMVYQSLLIAVFGISTVLGIIIYVVTDVFVPVYAKPLRKLRI